MADGVTQNENEPPEDECTKEFSSKNDNEDSAFDISNIPSAIFTDEDLDRDGDHLQFLPPLPPQPAFSTTAFTNGSNDSGRRKEFNIETLDQCLKSCLRPTDVDIDVDGYLNSYREICKLLDNLGTVIRAYIGGDIRQKIGIIRQYKAGPNGAFYDTIERMIAFEKRNRIHKKNVDENGSRTILRLHRSLYFVAEFLGSLNKINSNQSVGSVGREAYNKTLAPFHPWAYKRIARIAFSTLGEKGSLVDNFHDGSMTPFELQKMMDSVVSVANRVCNQCQGIYEKYDFLDLP